MAYKICLACMMRLASKCVCAKPNSSEFQIEKFLGLVQGMRLVRLGVSRLADMSLLSPI